MYRNKEFDYDLWTTETDCEKKYWVRVRNTNEVVEVNLETMRFLRNQEKSLYRKFDDSGIKLLSFDIFDEEISNELLIDKRNFEDIMLLKIIEKEVFAEFTDCQKEIYLCVIKDGESISDFARRKHITYRGVSRTIEMIRIKFKKFLN